MVFVVLSPDSPFPLRISGSPATFIDRILKVPDAAEARGPSWVAGAAKQNSLLWLNISMNVREANISARESLMLGQFSKSRQSYPPEGVT
jgi:hypothetical protein